MFLSRRAVPLFLAVLALAAGGCGGDDEPSGTTVDVVFDEGGMQVTPTKIPSGEDVTLQVSAPDGRPHGVTLDGAPTPVRVVITPGQVKSQAAGELPDGTYRVAPDGATEPVEITVGP